MVFTPVLDVPQLDLIIFPDTRVFVDTNEEPEVFEQLSEEDHAENDTFVFMGVGDVGLGRS